MVEAFLMTRDGRGAEPGERRLTMIAALNFPFLLLDKMLDKIEAHYSGMIRKADKTATAQEPVISKPDRDEPHHQGS